MNLEEATEIVKEYKQDKETSLPATLYLPPDDYSEVYKEHQEKNRFVEEEPSIKGVDVELDPLIQDAQILSDSLSDSHPLWLKDPPEDKIKECVEVEKKEYEDPLRGTITQYTTHAWLKPFCKWQRFDEDMVEKYGHPLSTHNLDVRFGENNEYTKTEFDEYERQKFGYENVTSSQMDNSDLDMETRGDEWAEREMPQAIHRALWNVHVEPVYVYRERTFEGAYPVLDIEHEEKLKFGKHGTTYEGMLMRKIDTDVHKLEMRE